MSNAPSKPTPQAVPVGKDDQSSRSTAINDLRITVVGMYAIVLREDDDGNPVGVRVLFPGAECERRSISGARATIPVHVPVLGIGVDQHVYPPENTLFKSMFQFPGTALYAGTQPFLEMAFYDTHGVGVVVDGTMLTNFQVNDREIDPEVGPTTADAKSIRWLADMRRYAPEERYYTVDEKYMSDPERGAWWSYIDLDFGLLEVACVERSHRFRFIHLSNPGDYHQALASSIRISTKVQGGVTFGFGGQKVAVQAVDNVIDVLMGSATVDGIAHPAIVDREHCAMPAFHGELLYDFSQERPVSGFAPVAVCSELHDDDKDPNVGYCKPPSKMVAPSGTSGTKKDESKGLFTFLASTAKGVALARNLPAISLHVGVDHYSSRFLDVRRVSPATLNSCANDANATAALALRRGFRADTLLDFQATAAAITKAIEDARTALSAAGGLFVVTFSCYGVPQPVRKGWCVNDRILAFDGTGGVIPLLKTFHRDSKIFVVSDCCFSGQDFAHAAGVKQLSVSFAEELMRLSEPSRLWNIEISDTFGALDESAESPAIYELTACAANETTPDGLSSGTSPFTTCLLGAFNSNPNLSFDDLLASVRSCSAPRKPELDRLTGRNQDFENLGPIHV